MDAVQLKPALTVERVTRPVTLQASDSPAHASRSSLESFVKLVSLYTLGLYEVLKSTVLLLYLNVNHNREYSRLIGC